MSTEGCAGIETLSKRYEKLVQEVISRLPPDWNIVNSKLKAVTFAESDQLPTRSTGLAHTEFPSRFGPEAIRHRITLYERNLSGCSDDVVKWTIAHELGHVVSSHLVRFVHEERFEEIADSLAMGWGFAKEWEAFALWNEATWSALESKRTEKK